jgi:hypothetical protein
VRHHPLRSLATIEDEEAPRKARVRAANDLAIWARSGQPGVEDVQNLHRRVIQLWRDLCAADEEPSWSLLMDRGRAAAACTTLSPALPDGQNFFRNIPRINDAEGPHPRKEGVILRGKFGYMYRSIYDFHREYPIEGFGVRKDLISVVEADGTRVPVLDWLPRKAWVVWCSGCGLDITTEVANNCPARFLMARGSKPRIVRTNSPGK